MNTSACIDPWPSDGIDPDDLRGGGVPLLDHYRIIIRSLSDYPLGTTHQMSVHSVKMSTSVICIANISQRSHITDLIKPEKSMGVEKFI